MTLEERTRLETFPVLVDGGYLSYVTGVSFAPGWANWHLKRWLLSDALFLMDSPKSVRRDAFSDYKIKRAVRRKQDPSFQEKHERVGQFRNFLWQDNMICTTTVKGYEADDLIAYLHCKGYGEKLIAIDKDLLQVPGFHSKMQTHRGHKPEFRLKLPNYATQPKLPWQFLMNQALYGDKSDSIPRLLSSHPGEAKVVYQTIMEQDYNGAFCFAEAMKWFGEDFTDNLMMVLIPHMSLSVNYDLYLKDPETLFVHLANSSYWKGENLRDDPLIDLQEILRKSLVDPFWETVALPILA